MKVTLTKAGQTVASASHGVVVTRPPGTGQGANVVVDANGNAASQPVAEFEVPNITDTAGEFAATIAWGDGTTSVGTISGGSGLFQVVGAHHYATAGPHTVEVKLSQSWYQSLFFLVVVSQAPAAAPLPRKVQIGVFMLGAGQTVAAATTIKQLYNDFNTPKSMKDIFTTPAPAQSEVIPANAAAAAIAFARKAVAAAKKANEKYVVDIFGYSRGGALSPYIAAQLEDSVENAKVAGVPKASIPIGFLGLVDPVVTGLTEADTIYPTKNLLTVPGQVSPGHVWVGIHTQVEKNFLERIAVTPAKVETCGPIVPEKYFIEHVPMGQAAGSNPKTSALRYVQDLEDAAQIAGVVWNANKLPRK